MKKCSDCTHFYEPNCRRYPHSMECQPGWFCGEYRKKPVVKKKDTRNSELIAYYCEVFKDRFGNQALIQSPDAAAAVAIIKAYDLTGSKMWIDKFLDPEHTPKWNQEHRLFRLRDAPSAIQKMSAYDD